MTLALYGCGDSSPSKKTDSSVADASVTTTNTNTNTDTLPPTSTVTTTTTVTNTVTSTNTAIDASPGNPDSTPVTPSDGGATIGLDGGTTIGLDGGTTIGLDSGATIGLDSGATIGQDGATTPDVPATTPDAALNSDVTSTPDAATTSDAPASTGNCNYPQCYIDLVKDCVPSGACVQQTTTIGSPIPTSSNIAICYDNGVKMLTVMDFSNVSLLTQTETVKNASGVCYTMEALISAASSGNITYTMKNAAGATVATLAIDTTAQTETITCTGGPPVVVPTNCGSSNSDAGSGTTCTTGTCAF
jgi:hypothetical protein